MSMASSSCLRCILVPVDNLYLYHCPPLSPVIQLSLSATWRAWPIWCSSSISSPPCYPLPLSVLFATVEGEVDYPTHLAHDPYQSSAIFSIFPWSIPGSSILNFRKHTVPLFLFQMFFLLTGTIGNIFSFQVFGQVIVVLNTAEAAKDLLERRAGAYSDRPRNVVALFET